MVETLNERFRDGAPRRVPEQVGAWLTAEEMRFVLWATLEHWPATRIGKALGVNEVTVRRFRRRYMNDPSLIISLGLGTMVGRARDEEFFCLVCSERVEGHQKIDVHVLDHFLEPGEAQAYIESQDRWQEHESEGKQ